MQSSSSKRPNLNLNKRCINLIKKLILLRVKNKICSHILLIYKLKRYSKSMRRKSRQKKNNNLKRKTLAYKIKFKKKLSKNDENWSD